jgi:hypothetical protein
MSADQLETVVKNSQWDEEKRDWKIPHFTYR